MPVVIGIDVGTTGVRVLAVDQSGKLVAESTSEYPLYTPRPGWTEQNPEDWWTATQESLHKVVQQVKDEILGLGLTGQMHGSVFLDERGEVIRPALLWNDQRTAKQCEEMTEIVGYDRLIAIAGNPALTGFQAPKILWLRENEPENYSKVRHVLLPKDYVRYKLTGEFATDASDAAGTLLLDVKARDWSTEILEALEIPLEWLPKVFEGPEVTGYISQDLTESLGLGSKIPVAAGGGDNAAAAVGTGIIKEGLMSSSIGTSGVLFVHSEEFRPDPSGRIHAFCHAVPGKYHLMGVTLSAGGSLRWWRDLLGGLNYDQLSELASTAPPGSEGLLFLPYLTGERTPHLDPHARGSFFGLTARHDKSHMTRAVMEGVVFSMLDSLQIIRELDVEVNEVRAIGGGARSPLWRQIQADIYRLPIKRTVAEEGPAYGAALLAGVASGIYKDVEDACSLIALRDEITYPDQSRSTLYARYYEVYKSLYPNTKDAMHQLSELASI